MKKLFLLVLVASFGMFTMAQQAQQFKAGVGEHFAPANNELGHNYLSPTPTVKPPSPNLNAGVAAKDVIIRELGNAGNAWGLSSGGRTYMWADNDIQSVVFGHRMLNPPGTGFLAYDVSTDQGATFTSDVQIWDPGLYPTGAALGNARYPQVAIYNPAENTDPANAYMTFFAPILDQSNGASWGGYGMGTNPLTAVDPPIPLQSNFTSSGDVLIFSVPDAFHMKSDGQAICYEPSLVEGLFAGYTGSLIYTAGYYDESTMMFDYQQSLVEFDITAGGEGATIPSQKIAFHEDGQVGYMAMLSNNGFNTDNEGALYPVLFKTTNGGEDWDGPYAVQLGGPDGLPAVLNYLTDDLIEMMFEPPAPARDEILYTTAFDMDLAVDMSGNPHLLFCVGVGSGEWSIITSLEGLTGTGNTIAMIHAASYDGMDTWYADTLNTPPTFRGEFAGSDILSEDLRPYISVTPDGSKMFFSWQSTDIENVDDNISPDIYCMGYDVANLSYTELYNVSAFTAIMWQSWMATASYYVFDDGAGSYEVPFSCQIMNPTNNLDPVSFRYVDDFVITDDDFGVWTSAAELDQEFISISSNYPNPCKDFTNVNMTLIEAANVTLEISNLIGQKVKSINYGPYNKGLHTVNINVADLESGIYIYTLSTGKDAVAGKMIVE
jgi:hypothetical protein